MENPEGMSTCAYLRRQAFATPIANRHLLRKSSCGSDVLCFLPAMPRRADSGTFGSPSRWCSASFLETFFTMLAATPTPCCRETLKSELAFFNAVETAC